MLRLKCMIEKMNNRTPFSLLAILFLSVMLFGCADPPVPKPRGYFRIDFPAKSYRLFDSIYPFRFMYPTYSVIVPKESADSGVWLNVDFTGYKATLHLSYKNVHGDISKMIEDARSLAYKHTVKADAIDEQFFSNQQEKVYGVLYDIRGNSASSVQFFVTDSTQHYLRGALYFRCVPNKDSLAPAVDFFKKDVVHLLETLSWK